MRRLAAAAAAAAAVNIAAHAVLVPSHLAEMPYIGELFIAGNVVLLVGVVLLATRRGRLLGWSVLVLTSIFEFAAFLASRTIGLPAGYKEGWAPTGENLLGWLSLATEVVIVAAAYLALDRAAVMQGVRDIRVPQHSAFAARSEQS